MFVRHLVWRRRNMAGDDMNYIPNLHLKDEMLKEMGLNNIDQLFEDIPPKIRIGDVKIPEGMSELEASRDISAMFNKNVTCGMAASFLGGGMYRHFIPSSVNVVGGRSELYTAYTPYQPELSQGMLQALWEYQSYIAELTGLPVVNTSMYDWASALGEAVRMALRVSKKNKVLIAKSIHWERKQTLANYSKGTNAVIKEIPYDPGTGQVDMGTLTAEIDENTAALYIENPNLFGVWEEEAPRLKAMLNGGVLIVGCNPMSLAVAKPPGEYGADICIGEAQVFGNYMSYGGPTLGMFSCKKEFMRGMPGRIIGITKDIAGKRAFCMTLSTREQHIRRAKATSNICSNEAMCSVRAAAYLAIVGNDLKNVAEHSAVKAHWLASELDKVDGCNAPIFEGPYFNEFVLRVPSAKNAYRHLLNNNIFGGIKLKSEFPDLGETLLVATTEMNTEEELQRYVKAMKTLEVK